MIDKLDYYDTLGIVIPGTLLGYWLPICFPQIAEIVATVRFPAAVAVVAFVAVAFFIGHLVQAAASLIEPVLYRAWGGRPSERALREGLGDRFLPAASAVRIRAKLAAAVGPEADDRSLFLWAMAKANGAPHSRSQTFNSLYAYHRGLLVVAAAAAVALLGSLFGGAADDWSGARVISVLAVLLALSVLLFYRAEQRASYYVREVLIVAERVLDEAAANRGTGAAGAPKE